MVGVAGTVIGSSVNASLDIYSVNTSQSSGRLFPIQFTLTIL